MSQDGLEPVISPGRPIFAAPTFQPGDGFVLLAARWSRPWPPSQGQAATRLLRDTGRELEATCLTVPAEVVFSCFRSMEVRVLAVTIPSQDGRTRGGWEPS
jgi:hypothetical protein